MMVPQNSRTRIEGDLSYDTENIIGRGAFSSVFRGFYRNSLLVAVRRTQRTNLFDYNQHDYQKLQLFRVTQHPNILRSFGVEMNEDFIYIATELCEGTLEDYIKGMYHGPKFKDEKEMLHQITKGVAYLHGCHIVHRNIKPTNILIYLAGADGSMPQIKLNIPTIAKSLKAGREDFSNTSLTSPIGTRGWMAPEMYLLERLDSKVDIWALGCVFAYALTGGEHPFGEDVKTRADLIRKNKMLMTINDLKRPYCNDNSTFELIQSLLEAESRKRPSAEQILSHVFFNVLNVEIVQATTSVLRKNGEYLSYDRCKFLGRGGFACVFQGIWKNPAANPLTGERVNQRYVAVKRIEKYFNKPASVQKEVELMLKVKEHPNILQFFTTDEDLDFLFIVTELCNGTLKEWMERKYQGPSIGDERNILFQVTKGLAYLHANNIVHRDIKPSNILISIPEVEGGEPMMKLADFGISKILTKENGFTNTNVDDPSGTSGYKAPELYQSDRFGFEIDVYSLGVVFGQVLSKEKKNPFNMTSSMESTMVLKQEDIIEPYSNDCLVFDLIKSMVNVKSEDRPKAQKVLENSFFHPLNMNTINYGQPIQGSNIVALL